MKLIRLHMPRWLALTAAGLAIGCAAEEPVVRPNPVDPQVIAKSRKDLAATLQETRNTAIKVKDQASLLMTALDRVVDPDQKDLRGSYDSFTKAFATFDSDAASLKRLSGTVRSDGQEFLTYWEQDLASLANEDVRDEGEERRDEVLESFTDTQAALDKAVGSVSELQVLVGDVKKYLDNTLSTEGVEHISGVADEARDSSEKAVDRINEATEAIDRMVKEMPT